MKNKGIIIHDGNFTARNVAVGDQACVMQNNKHDNPEKVDLQSLANELRLLRAALKNEATIAEHDIAIGAIADAEISARKENWSKTLEYLKVAGKWSLSVAEKHGVGIAVSMLKKALGI